MASNENFYKRLRSLSGISDKLNESKGLDTRTLVNFERSKDGTAYGIVKENHNYFIKKSLVKGDALKASDFTHINGIENKGRYEFKSLSEAEKQRNFYVKGINEAWDQGGVFLKEDHATSSAPKLDVKEDINSFLKSRINEGKKSIDIDREKKFKTNLTPTKTETSKRGLMPEAADVAVKKALGLLKEEAIVTSDSEIKDKDKVSEKSGKEESTSPINDKNAKKEADKATGTGKKDANKKGDDSKSIAVNQANKTLKENEDLSTADSQIVINDSPANSKASKEAAQAPINDENAKKEAEKRDAKGSASAAISNNADEQEESDPFEDKENVGEGDSDIVSEDVNKGKPFDKKSAGGKDIVAADSDQKDGDKIANKSGHEKPEAPYNNYNQPEKGHKAQKGVELKAKASEKDIVSEGDIITADSEQKESDVVANKTKVNLPKKTGKSEITADSELNASKALANMTKTKLPNPIAEGADLSTADSEIDATSSLANDVSEAGDDGEAELDAAAAALGDLDVAAAEEPAAEPVADAGVEDAPETEEQGGEDAAALAASNDSEQGGGEDALAADAEGDGQAEEPVADDAGEAGGEDLMTKEIEKLVGKLTQKVRNTDLTPDQAKGFLKSLIDSFENDLGEVDVEDRKQMSDKILKAQTGNIGDDDGSGEEEVDTDAGQDVETGMDKSAEAAIDSKIEDLNAGGDAENPAGEPAAADAGVEEPVKEMAEMSDDMCSECGTFESYMEARGYSKDSLSECSASEMGNLVSSYAQAHDEGLNDGDFESVALYVTPEVANEVKEYGQGGFIEKLQPYLENISEDQQVQFGAHEPMLSPVEEDAEDGVEDVASEIEGGEDVVASEIEGSEDIAAEPIGFAQTAQTLGAGVAKPTGAGTKSVEIDLNNGKVSVQVSESEQKIRKYVRAKLEELDGKRKPSMNESKKSESLKKLDRLIEQQWKLNGKNIENVIAKEFSKNGKK